MYFDDLLRNGLPKQFTEEELQEAFRKYYLGNVEARNEIIERNIAFVLYIVMNEFKENLFDKQELVSVGLIGLIKAVDSYDLNKVKFSTYMYICIRREILMFIKKANKYIYDTSLENEIQFSDKKIPFFDVSENQYCQLEQDYEKKELDSIIRQIVNSLPEREKTIITLYFGFEGEKRFKQHELADKLGLSQSQIHKIIKKTLKKIKFQLKQNEIIGIVHNEKVKQKSKGEK